MTEPAAHTTATVGDLAVLRETIADAAEAAASGGWPFAAQIVSTDGSVLCRTVNAVGASGDPTAHAELHAIRLAARERGIGALAGATLYASAEPCAMCAGAIHWAGVARVFFGVSEMRLRALYGAHPPFDPLRMSCREVFASANSPVIVTGPLIEEEAAAVHRTFWTTYAAATVD